MVRWIIFKYLVWWTGSATENCLHGRYNGYFYPTRNEIVAFVDNGNNKSGKIFWTTWQYNMKDVLNSKNIIISGLSHHLLSKFEFNGIIMKPELKEDLYEFCTFFHKKVLGVCYRGMDYNLDIGLFHPIQPTVNTAIKTVKKKIEEWGMGSRAKRFIENIRLYGREEWEIVAITDSLTERTNASFF